MVLIAMNRHVAIAGWGQVIQPKHQASDIESPLGLMARAAREAALRTGQRDLLEKVDGVMVVRIMSRHYDAPDRQLAERLGIRPVFSMVSTIGGNSPQLLVNRAAGLIARGELRSVLIAGAETYCPRPGQPPLSRDTLFQGIAPDYQGDDLIGSTPLEERHGIVLPADGFPLFETALWADSGLSLDAYLARVGALWASFSRTAAENPVAWSRTPRTAEEIVTPGPANRMIAFPYTKYMNPFVSVDLGAAVIVSAVSPHAGSIKGRRPVYFIGGGSAVDRQRFLIERSDFTASPPLKKAAARALDRAALTLDQIDCFDFYSCFPCAPAIAGRMLGLDPDDSRPRTMTGGLGFFGGPGNNYSLHAIATLAEAISNGRYENGLITALGWFMHKHAAGVYSTTPISTGLDRHDLADDTDSLAGDHPVPITEFPEGSGTIETYTVNYGRDMQPESAVIYGRLKDNTRFVAMSDNRPFIQDLTLECWVGRPVVLYRHPDGERNLAEPPSVMS